MRHAIAASTRRTYAAPLRAYAAFCAERGISADPADTTAEIAGEWLAQLAIGGTIRGATLRLYRSALSTAWEESGARGANPLQSELIARHIRGATRMLLQGDIDARAARERTIELTPALLAQLQPAVEADIKTAGREGDTFPLLCWAATCFGVFGLLRPSEFLSAGYHRYESRLTEAAVCFRASPNHEGEAVKAPFGRDPCQFMPDRFDFTLGPTKADPFAHNGRVVIAAPMCVNALWRWVNQRRQWKDFVAIGPGLSAPLFLTEDGRALSRPRLLAQIERWLARLMGSAPKITGKAFRRGGATGMLQNGASVPDIMNAGRWRSAAMVGVYTSAEAQRNSATAASRAMDPTSVSAAAAASPSASR
jgi:hypothetical protein